MLKTIQALHGLIGAIVSLALLVVVATGGWFAYNTYYGRQDAETRLKEREVEVQQLSRNLKAQQQEIASLNKDLEVKRREIQRLETAVKLLKVDHRVAYLDVISQEDPDKDGVPTTKFRWIEVDQQGRPLRPSQEFSVAGDMVHVDAYVVKFNDKNIEEGDPLRSTSLCVFKRIYGDKQRPVDGFSIDSKESLPAPYGGKEMSDLERQIWDNFWKYSNDPESASKLNIRAAHGDGVYQKLVPGKRYRIQLRASDGLSIVPENLPAPTAGGAY